MSVTLPDDLAWVLNILGFVWPQADEDRLQACAQAWRDFGAQLDRIQQETRLIAADVTAENHGESIDSFTRYWHGIGGGGGDFDRARESADRMAVALDGMAMLVTGVKAATITQLTILAAEIIADQVAAPETLGLSEGVAVGEVVATRLIVRRIVQEAIQRISREIVQQLKGRVLELFRKILATQLRQAVPNLVAAGGLDFGKQELEINVLHTRNGIDLNELSTVTVLGVVIPGRHHGPGKEADLRAPAVVTRNNYRFTLDSRGRTVAAEGSLVLKKSERDPKAQLAAGSGDRRTTDSGGHIISIRFNGPSDAINHFAQDRNFNNASYKALENQWVKALKGGKPVDVRISLTYPAESLRPSKLDVQFKIDGEFRVATFMNEHGGGLS